MPLRISACTRAGACTESVLAVNSPWTSPDGTEITRAATSHHFEAAFHSSLPPYIRAIHTPRDVLYFAAILLMFAAILYALDADQCLQSDVVPGAHVFNKTAMGGCYGWLLWMDAMGGC